MSGTIGTNGQPTPINGYATQCPDDSTLATASFRGVPFFVDKEDVTAGRRIVTHEFPNRDDPEQEDLGQKEVTFSVHAYLYGGNSVQWRDDLLAACTIRGPAILVLPTMTTTAVCKKIVVSRSKDKLGWFDVSLEFGKSKSFSLAVDAAPYPAGYAEQQVAASYADATDGFADLYAGGFMSLDIGLAAAVEALVGGALGVLVDALQNGEINTALALQTYALANSYTNVSLSGFQAVQSFVTENAVSRVQDFAASVILQAESATPLDPTAAADIVRSATSVFHNADTYCEANPATGTVDPTIVTVAAASLASLVQNLSPEDGAQAMLALCNFTSQPPGALNAPSDVMDAMNEFVFAGTVRRLALIQYAQVLCTYTFRTRAQAIQLRANLVEMFYQELVNLGTDDGTASAMITARDTAVQYITKTMASLASVVQIAAPRPFPALYWAYRLYSDPTRADELADRNEAADPLFIPSTFEALSK